MSQSNEHICDFGLHQGQSYTKLPASFLNWMVGNNHEKSALAEQELNRRQLAATGQLETEN
ncbi:MAG: hypothetical protein ACPG5Z_14805 [Pseudoalteromonas sp.]|uniref:hypothetical protein n=1 Tax=unclassified Pseudoalteromonas TaxID=194690 RepID=UPI000C075B06|nr:MULTISPECIES: hypothetical protein [unclassified Pseudoalteromonas]MDP2635611.1 hypothetical protein [Pseudoalteromonas sp. 1_MG-2023]PHN88896.1 hypothetical protein CSC79_15505 [Pseudoalteromonas sp. 3D05]TGE85267.1 hypothetical protein C7Y70_02715 [Pseudoalteromonas sp. KS88]